MVAATMTMHARRLIAPLLATLALAYLVVMVIQGAQPVRTHLIKFEVKGVMTQNPGSIVRATVTNGTKSNTFDRQAGTWVKRNGKQPVSSKLAKSINLAVKFMQTAEPVRIFKINEVGPDAASKFGLSKPSLSIRLDDAHGFVLEAIFGDLTSNGLLHYMRVRARNERGRRRGEYYLMSRFVHREWQAVADGTGR